MNQAPYPGCNQAQSSAEAFALHAGVCRVQSVAVQHCHDAYGLVLEHGSGWKLVFSGDTRPCPALERAGADCTLLIHEATFDSALAHQAVQKRHSTISEAIGVATKMRAFRTILTHFSQRYAKLPAGSSCLIYRLCFPLWLLPLTRLRLSHIFDHHVVFQLHWSRAPSHLIIC